MDSQTSYRDLQTDAAGSADCVAEMPDSPSYSSEELETWSAVATLLEWLPAALDAQMQRDSQISHFEFGILFALSAADGGSLRMSALADYASSTLSRLSRAIARLERKGWVARKPDPNDGRSTIASLLEPGREVVRSATPGHVALVRKLVFEPLNRTQTRQLRESSLRITAAICEEGAWRPK